MSWQCGGMKVNSAQDMSATSPYRHTCADGSYKVMPLARVLTYEDDAEKQNVSIVARSPRGFLSAYKAARTWGELKTQLVPASTPGAAPTQTWAQRRAMFVARHLPQYETNPTYRRRLALIMWAYDPGPGER